MQFDSTLICRYGSRSFCNILLKKNFEYRADERLNEKQLGEKCKRKVKAYQFQPIGKQGKYGEACIVGIIQKCSQQTHGRAHQPYGCADNRCLKQNRMRVLRGKDLSRKPKGAGTSHNDLQTVGKTEFHKNNTPNRHHSAAHIDTALSMDCVKDAVGLVDGHKRIAVYHVQAEKDVGMDGYNDG